MPLAFCPFHSVLYDVLHVEAKLLRGGQILLAVIQEEAFFGLQTIAREQYLVESWVGFLHLLDARNHYAVKQLQEVESLQSVMEGLGGPVGQAVEAVSLPFVLLQPCHILLYASAQTVGKMVVVAVYGLREFGVKALGFGYSFGNGGFAYYKKRARENHSSMGCHELCFEAFPRGRI